MKKIELIVQENQCNSIDYIISKFNIPFYKNTLHTVASKTKSVQYLIFAPDATARKIMEQLNNILDTKNKDNLISSHPLEALFSEYLEKKEENKKSIRETPKLREEFRTLTEPAVDFKINLLIVVLVASTAALIGLFANNPSIIIGAMLVAPLLRPITAFSFNVSVFNVQKIIKSGISLGLLIGSIVGISALLTLVAIQIMPLEITAEIEMRTKTSPTFMVLAIVLGIAGSLALSSNIPGILAGVAIAAALVPPAVVMGIGLAMLDSDILFGSSILTLSNVIGLLLGTLIVFLLAGVTPKQYGKNKLNKKYIIYMMSVLVTASVLAFWLSF